MKRISKRLIIFGLLLFTAICMMGVNSNNVYAQCNESAISSLEDYTLKQASKYVTIDNNGNKIIDIERAKQAKENNTIIKILALAIEMQADEENAFRNIYNLNDYAEPKSNITHYGHYCGKGNDGNDKIPIDDLDAACKEHDKCYVWGGDNTQCNATFCVTLNRIIRETSATSFKGAYARSARLIFCWF